MKNENLPLAKLDSSIIEKLEEEDMLVIEGGKTIAGKIISAIAGFIGGNTNCGKGGCVVISQS